jgi:hypothetical protein
MNRSRLSLALLLLPLAACGDKDTDTADTGIDHGDHDTDTDDGTDTDGGTDTDVTDYAHSYRFDSAFEQGDSVSYSGQVFRHVLISDMKSHLGGMTALLDGGDWYPVSGEVSAELDFYLSFDSSTSGSVPLYFSTDPAPAQGVYDDISSDKDLLGKLAGNDSVGQHMDWSTQFVGVGEPGSTNPEALVRAWFAEIDAQAVDWSNGSVPLDPSGAPVPAVYVTPDGRDLQQLLEKFLRGAVSFSQGTDDYLDDDLEGKGLNSDHTAAEEGKPYTALEHQWDEGFGYFGASRSYDTWTDDEIADLGAMDDDGSGAIDLTREVAFGHSLNAAKRDLGSSAEAPTDMTAVAFESFLAGRQLLSETAGTELTEEQRGQLYDHRDAAVRAWEESIASTVVHYINDTLGDMSAMGGDSYDFATHAKHWSEMKGFALSLQFNPRSPLSDGDFIRLHELLGDAPVLADAGDDALAAGAGELREARGLIAAAYGFDASNLGDDDGNGGW